MRGVPIATSGLVRDSLNTPEFFTRDGAIVRELRTSCWDFCVRHSKILRSRLPVWVRDALVDVGPIILGHRLSTSKTLGAYQTLIYNKGALVLRMLHFMLSNPATGDGQPFFDMMTDFVERYRNKTASSDDFRAVANEHFARSPIAKKYGMTNLNWLFYQSVYQTALPSYELQYKIEDQPDGKVMLTGTISQQNAPADWVMVLPVKLSFGGSQEALGTVLVQGASSPFQIKLPMRPKKVELDLDRWILSEKISTKGN